jgi:hypothetical protein
LADNAKGGRERFRRNAHLDDRAFPFLPKKTSRETMLRCRFLAEIRAPRIRATHTRLGRTGLTSDRIEGPGLLYLLVGDCAVPGRTKPEEATPALLRRVRLHEPVAGIRRDTMRVRPAD